MTFVVEHPDYDEDVVGSRTDVSRATIRELYFSAAQAYLMEAFGRKRALSKLSFQRASEAEARETKSQVEARVFVASENGGAIAARVAERAESAAAKAAARERAAQKKAVLSKEREVKAAARVAGAESSRLFNVAMKMSRNWERCECAKEAEASKCAKLVASRYCRAPSRGGCE